VPLPLQKILNFNVIDYKLEWGTQKADRSHQMMAILAISGS